MSRKFWPEAEIKVALNEQSISRTAHPPLKMNLVECLQISKLFTLQSEHTEQVHWVVRYIGIQYHFYFMFFVIILIKHLMQNVIIHPNKLGWVGDK